VYSGYPVSARDRQLLSRKLRKVPIDLQLGTKDWYDFIGVYYRVKQRLSTYFITERYRPNVLRLLQGDVYDEAQPPVLENYSKRRLWIEDFGFYPKVPNPGPLGASESRIPPSASSWADQGFQTNKLAMGVPSGF
jgi:hypothetical protein